MGYDRENALTMQKLKDGKTCLVQGIGNSMTPILKSKQICEVIPTTESIEFIKGDIVFCKVNGHFYLHKVLAFKGKQYQIGNNHGHINGWVTRNSIYGKVVNII